MHTVSLEVARQMKDAGWKQEGEWWWVKTAKGWRLKPKRWLPNKPFDFRPDHLIAAPTLGEIVREIADSYWIDYDHMNNYWAAFFVDDHSEDEFTEIAIVYAYDTTAPNPEDAAGLAWVKQQGDSA